MTSEDTAASRSEDVPESSVAETAGEGARESHSGPKTSSAQDTTAEGAARSRRPLRSGILGLIAGIAGGIVGTTVAPNNLILTIVLVVGVAGAVTLVTLRLLAGR
ncbi:hypothetical protein [Salinarchaeum laminariae]|uniref:hypothetical protein n=1 Tax=Salinarchaeum laminariae TaxID=869888 RepID=UPI0020BDC61B|nr:hypothetical protein [Salinarchaeum laminariae]